MKRLIVALLGLALHSTLLAGDPPGNVYEQSLLETIKNIQSLNHEQALLSTRDLIRQYPHSRLGHMLYADLLLAKATPLTEIGSGIAIDRAMQDFRHEIQQRWQHDTSPAHLGRYPENILFLADNQPYVILVDLEGSRVYVYRNHQGSLALETDYFTTIGVKGYGKQKRGDQKTPIGVYHVTSHIDGSELPDLYGEGAFPINYPNVWDKRLQRTGSGIWIHGTPSYTYNRSPWASDGCIVVSNPDFLHIERYISPETQTPVVIAKSVNWLSHDEWQTRRRDALQLMSAWLNDWESLDHDRYASHYSRAEFNAKGRDYRAWDGHKRWVNRNKTFVAIEYSNLNVFRYPGEQDLMLMQYAQSYRSNNLNVDSGKEIFWRRNDERWRIVYEGNRRLAAPEQTAAVD